jgi:hydroxymethylpyrimidine/phosphomethylpyrimidine kinase
MSLARPVALTIAGSDPSGGAGIQADLKTFHQFGVYGEAVITLITVQNTRGVERMECLAPDLVADQIRAVIGDILPAAVKTGALGNCGIIEAVAGLAAGFRFPLVVDPVILSKNGAALLEADAVDALKTRLLPHTFLLTPNLEEAALLTGVEVRNIAEMRVAAQKLASLGPRAVLVKGGHLGDDGDATDVLFYRGEFREFTSPRIATRNTHGTGCTFSAAITAGLAWGRDLPEAVERAKRYVTEAIRTNPGFGAGAGPLDHHAYFRSSGFESGD